MRKIRHNSYRDCKLIVKVEMDNNTLLLVQDTNPGYKQHPTYFVYWGSNNSNMEQAGREEIRTLTGRKVSQKTAIRKFTQMIGAAKYLTFSKI